MKSSNKLLKLISAVLLAAGFLLTPLHSAFAAMHADGMVDISTCDVYLADDKKEGGNGKDGKGKEGKDGEEPDCE